MEIKVRVLGVADASLAHVFDGMPEAQKRVFARLEADERAFYSRRAARARQSTDTVAREQGRGGAYRTGGRQANDDVAIFDKAEKDKTRIALREQRIRDQIRDNTFRKVQRDEETFARQARSIGQRRFGVVRDMGRSVSSDLGVLGRGAIGAA